MPLTVEAAMHVRPTSEHSGMFLGQLFVYLVLVSLENVGAYERRI